jgi:hypothetical protein
MERAGLWSSPKSAIKVWLTSIPVEISLKVKHLFSCPSHGYKLIVTSIFAAPFVLFVQAGTSKGTKINNLEINGLFVFLVRLKNPTKINDF